MDKREQINKALRRLLEDHFKHNTLAKQAIVIECEVEHRRGADDMSFTKIGTDEQGFVGTRLLLVGHHGTPGKALAIIVPLEEDDDSVQPRDLG